MSIAQITASKEFLLGKLHENREKHQGEFEKAHRAWREAFVKRVEKMLAAAKAERKFEQYVGLDEPRSHIDDYDLAIGMLKAHTEATIPLSAVEYRNFVDDKWNWKQDFTANASRYVVGEE